MKKKMARSIAAGIASTLTVLMFASGAFAHNLGEGYLFLKISDTQLDGSFEITLEDLDAAVGLDGNADGKVSDAEVDAEIGRISDYLLDRLGVGASGNWYGLDYTSHEIRSIPLSRFLILNFEIDAPSRIPDEIDLRYEVLFDTDPQHRGFLVVTENAKTGVVNTGEDITLRFDPGSRNQTLDMNALSRWSTFSTFVQHGTWHIWIGIDHILFLLALILPAVLIRQEGRWQGVKDFGPALWQVIKIVTLFTIAHTITLSLAALGLVSVPSRIVESVIAASVIIAALNNIYPILRDHLGIVVFGFGLFHGFGFASVLSHLITNRNNLVLDLLGFNVGVELGQIGIIALAFPVLFAMRHTGGYLRLLVPVGSMAIAGLAMGWLLERALELSFMPI